MNYTEFYFDFLCFANRDFLNIYIIEYLIYKYFFYQLGWVAGTHVYYLYYIVILNVISLHFYLLNNKTKLKVLSLHFLKLHRNGNDGRENGI